MIIGHSSATSRDFVHQKVFTTAANSGKTARSSRRGSATTTVDDILQERTSQSRHYASSWFHSGKHPSIPKGKNALYYTMACPKMACHLLLPYCASLSILRQLIYPSHSLKGFIPPNLFSKSSTVNLSSSTSTLSLAKILNPSSLLCKSLIS